MTKHNQYPQPTTAHESGLETDGKISAAEMAELGQNIIARVKDIEKKSLEAMVNKEKPGTNREERLFVKTSADMLTRAAIRAAAEQPQSNSQATEAMMAFYGPGRRMASAFGDTAISQRLKASRNNEQPISYAETMTELIQRLDLADNPSRFNSYSSNLAEVVETGCAVLETVAANQEGLQLDKSISEKLGTVIRKYDQLP